MRFFHSLDLRKLQTFKRLHGRFVLNFQESSLRAKNKKHNEEHSWEVIHTQVCHSHLISQRQHKSRQQLPGNTPMCVAGQRNQSRSVLPFTPFVNLLLGCQVSCCSSEAMVRFWSPCLFLAMLNSLPDSEDVRAASPLVHKHAAERPAEG